MRIYKYYRNQTHHHIEYGSTFQKDSNCNMPCSWACTDPPTFLIHGDSFSKTNERKHKRIFMLAKRIRKCFCNASSNIVAWSRKIWILQGSSLGDWEVDMAGNQKGGGMRKPCRTL